MIKYVHDKIQKDLNALFFKIEKENSKAEKFENGWNEAILMRYPWDIQLKILEHFSFSLDDAKKIASKKGISFDWAYRYYDPSQDGYSLIQKWLQMQGSEAKKELLNMLLNPSLKKILEWGWNRGREPTDETFDIAINEENPEVLKDLIETGLLHTNENYKIAVQEGNSIIIKYWIANGKSCDLYDAIAEGNVESQILEIVKIVIKGGVQPHCEHLNAAIVRGYLNVTKVLISNGVDPDRWHLNSAIEKGDLSTVKFLMTRVNATVWTLETAIGMKYLPIIEYLVLNGVKPDIQSLNIATKDGIPEIIDYVVKTGDFTIEDLNYAILWGYLEPLKILMKKLNYEHTEKDLKVAFQNEHLNIVEYFAKEWNIGTPEGLRRAEKRTRLDDEDPDDPRVDIPGKKKKKNSKTADSTGTSSLGVISRM